MSKLIYSAISTLNNKVQLIGNLGKGPESRRLLMAARKVAKFPLATTESYKNDSGEKVSETSIA
ncbi:MAG: single-stranded DNA-binding protein [Bacteroidales bacterium]